MESKNHGLKKAAEWAKLDIADQIKVFEDKWNEDVSRLDNAICGIGKDYVLSQPQNKLRLSPDVWDLMLEAGTTEKHYTKLFRMTSATTKPSDVIRSADHRVELKASVIATRKKPGAASRTSRTRYEYKNKKKTTDLPEYERVRLEKIKNARIMLERIRKQAASKNPPKAKKVPNRKRPLEEPNSLQVTTRSTLRDKPQESNRPQKKQKT